MTTTIIPTADIDCLCDRGNGWQPHKLLAGVDYACSNVRHQQVYTFFDLFDEQGLIGHYRCSRVRFEQEQKR